MTAIPEHNPFDPVDSLDTEAIKDRTALKFGKHRGKTPEQVAETDPGYIVWAYETVAQFDVCSAALYRECGGRRNRAVPTESAKKVAAVQDAKRKAAGDFDDFDDEIPF